MKSFSIRQTKQRFSNIMSAAGDGPVALTRYGKRVAIVMTPDHYEALLALGDAGRVNALDHVVADITCNGAMRTYSRRLLAALREGARRRS